MSIEYVAMNISELSKLSGLSTPTIRYYEQIKLLPKAKRKSNGYREYTDNDLKQLSLIQQAQQVGFSLAEIKAFCHRRWLSGTMTHSSKHLNLKFRKSNF